MTVRMFSVIFSILLLLSTPCIRAGAEVQMVLTPESVVAWAPSLGAADIAQPGADFPSTIQSDPALVDVDVTMLDVNNWYVTIERTADASWDPDLVLSVAVTSVGTPGTAGATCTSKFGIAVFSPLLTSAKTFFPVPASETT